MPTSARQANCFPFAECERSLRVCKDGKCWKLGIRNIHLYAYATKLRQFLSLFFARYVPHRAPERAVVGLLQSLCSNERSESAELVLEGLAKFSEPLMGCSANSIERIAAVKAGVGKRAAQMDFIPVRGKG